MTDEPSLLRTEMARLQTDIRDFQRHVTQGPAPDHNARHAAELLGRLADVVQFIAIELDDLTRGRSAS